MHSDFYEYVYYLSFKKSLKSYRKQFNNAWTAPIDDMDFFSVVEDPFVQNCIKAHDKLVELKLQLVLRFGIDEEDDLADEFFISESKRFKPYMLFYKSSKSYKKLKLYYERSLTEFIDSLYSYACVFTIQRYKIPQLFKRQIKRDDDVCLNLLNHDENTVALLMDLIIGLKRDLNELKLLVKR